jgi:hypothetical protein
MQIPGAPFFSAAVIGMLTLLVAVKARRVHETIEETAAMKNDV